MKSRRQTIGIVAAALAACFGVGLAVAAPQPPGRSVRVLAPGEAAGLTGGLCHDCVNCDSYRQNCSGYGVNNCTQENGNCTTQPAEIAIGTGTLAQKCLTSGPLAGGCGAQVEEFCLTDGVRCRCHQVSPGWECRGAEDSDMIQNFRWDPCN